MGAVLAPIGQFVVNVDQPVCHLCPRVSFTSISNLSSMQALMALNARQTVLLTLCAQLVDSHFLTEEIALLFLSNVCCLRLPVPFCFALT